jgi:hypothetical protein
MEELDKLLKGPEPLKTDRLSGPILDSSLLLGTDVWQEAIDQFDVFVSADAGASLPLEQQQYLSDLRVDRYLYDTLLREFGLLEAWIRDNPRHVAASQVASLLRRREIIGAASRIGRQENLYLWAQQNDRTNLALSILGWRLICQDLAASLLEWCPQKQHDPRGLQILLWQDSPGFYPQNRLRIWAARFLEDCRAPQILAWEAVVDQEIEKTHPELLMEAP